MQEKQGQREVRTALKNYFNILDSKQRPRFKTNILLDKKIKKALNIIKSCELCEHKCLANREKGDLGFCKVGKNTVVNSYFTHLSEEPFFVPSFTIFFWSCTFSCQFCQNWTISQGVETGIMYDPEDLAEIIDRNSHCKNINFVGGEPTPYLPFILQTLKHVKSEMPVIWNSNFYMSEESMALLKDTVDIYLSDWKYGSNECAFRLSGIQNYLEIIKRNHLLAFEDSELVIRHLVLPNHFECCTKPILEFISENFGKKVIVNLMDQYRPEFRAEDFDDIDRPLTQDEFRRVVDLAQDLGVNFIT